MKMLDGLPRQVLLGTLPLLIWSAHFALCYALVAARCSPGGRGEGAMQAPLLIGASLLALGACAALLWHAARAWPIEARLMDWARAGGALLALVGIAWTSLPLLMLDGCG